MKAKNPTLWLALILVCCVGCSSPNVDNNSMVPAVNDSNNHATPTPVVDPVSASTPRHDEADRVDTKDFEGTTDAIRNNNEITYGTAVLTAVRAAAHDNFDRIVFEFSDQSMPGYELEYLQGPARACGSDESVEVDGQALLQVRIFSTVSHTETGEPTIRSRELSPNLYSVKQLKSVCDFEGEVSWVVGVSAANKYRAFELKNPNRLIIDIAHQQLVKDQ